jgi:hypothetical protein
MITLYETRSWSPEILEKQYERTTASFAIRKQNGREIRDKIDTNNTRLWFSKDEAVENNRKRLASKAQNARQRLADAIAELEGFEREYGVGQ